MKRMYVVLSVIVVFCEFSASAIAERLPTKGERSAITRSLVNPDCAIRVHWIRVSTAGPYALVADSYCGQETVDLLKKVHSTWRDEGSLPDQGLSCAVLPRVVSDLRLERYNDGPRPCAEYGGGAGQAITVRARPVLRARLSRPADSAPAGTDATNLQLLNSRYLEPMGLPDATWSSLLATAAQNHADYWAQGGAFGHEEVPGRPGFTGVQPWDRCAAVGAPSCGEVAYEFDDLDAAMPGWLDTPYHGGALIASEQVGCGQSRGGSDCDLAGYSQPDGSDATAPANAPDSPVRIWPYDGATGVPLQFTGNEIPDPLAKYAGNHDDVGPALFIYVAAASAQITLTDAAGHPVPLLTPGAVTAASPLTVSQQPSVGWITPLVGQSLVGNGRYALSVVTPDGQTRVTHFTAVGLVPDLELSGFDTPISAHSASPSPVTITVTSVPSGRLLAHTVLEPGRSWQPPVTGRVRVCATQPQFGEYVAADDCQTAFWRFTPALRVRRFGSSLLIHAGRPLVGRWATVRLTVDECRADHCQLYPAFAVHHVRLRVHLRASTLVPIPFWEQNTRLGVDIDTPAFTAHGASYRKVQLLQLFFQGSGI